MADPGWGFASGFLTGTQEAQAIQLNNFKLQEAPVTLEQEKLALQISKQSFDAHQKMTQMLQQQNKENPTTNASETLTRAALDAIQSGLPEEGTKLLTEASTMMKQQTEAAYKNYQIARGKVQLSDSVLGMAHDEESWRQANATVQILTGEPSKFKDQPYSPELIKSIRQAGMTYLQKAEADLKATQARKARADEVMDSAHADTYKAMTKNYDSLVANRKKNGGGTGGTAKPATVTATKQALVTAFPGLEGDTDHAYTLARSIAPAVEELVSQGRTQEQAIQQAIRDHRQEFTGLETPRTRGGRSPDKPLPVPLKGNKPSPDPADYQDNMWYDTAEGPAWYEAKTKSFHLVEKPDDEDEDKEDQ